MATIEKIDEFNEFARRLAEQRGDEVISLDTVISQWKSLDQDDVAAVGAALESYDAGERGRPAREFLAERRGDSA